MEILIYSRLFLGYYSCRLGSDKENTFISKHMSAFSKWFDSDPCRNCLGEVFNHFSYKEKSFSKHFMIPLFCPTLIHQDLAPLLFPS